MCLNLRNSQYKSISEVEFLLNSNIISEKMIIEMKDNRQKIEETISFVDECLAFGI